MQRLVLALVVVTACGEPRKPPVAPAPDPDGDRITGAADLCPREPEPYNGVDDDDGCPDRPRNRQDCVWIDVLAILDRLYFDAGSTQLAPRMDPILEAVAATIVGNPQIERIAVVGGLAPGEPEPVAVDRAANVAKALVARGVAADRLESHGYARAISDDAAKRRAVWFVILRIDGRDTRPATGDGRWAPWQRDCSAREPGAPIDCDCLDARPPGN